MSMSLKDIIDAGQALSGAGPATIRAYIADRGGDVSAIAAEAQAEIKRIRDTYQTDPTITAELATLVQTVVMATDTPVEAPPEPEQELPAADTEHTEENTESKDQLVEANELPTVDDGAEVVSGDLVGAGAVGAETFQGRVMDLGVMRENAPTIVSSDTLATNANYEIFANGSTRKIETVGDLGAHVADQMKMVASAGGTDARGVSLVTYRAKDSWNRFHRSADMSDKDVVKLLDASVKHHDNFSGALFKHGRTSLEVKQFASTGWCAPSVDNFEFCPIPQAWGGFGETIPIITADRGGIRWPVSPSISDTWGDGIGCWTEAEEMAREDLKPCIELGCPGWVDYRNNICSICVVSSILTNRAFPEWTGNQVALYELMYEMWINWQMLQTAIGYARPVTWDTSGWGVWAALKEKIGFAIESLSARNLLDPQNHVWNLAIPAWLFSVIQADLSKRVGADLDMMSVSRERITMMLAGGRQLRIWPLSIWQTAITQTDIPDPAMRTWMGSDQSLDSGNYPETAEMLLWPQGAFVGVRDDFLDIRARWDYGLQRDNKQLQMFSETAWNVIPRCYEALHITLNICSAGRSGSLFEYPCNEAAPPPEEPANAAMASA